MPINPLLLLIPIGGLILLSRGKGGSGRSDSLPLYPGPTEPKPSPGPMPSGLGGFDPDVLKSWGLRQSTIDRILAVQPHIFEWALVYEMDPAFIASVIFCESAFRIDAQSSAGASGLMQLMPGTEEFYAESLGVEGDVLDPAYNIMLGTYGLFRHVNRWTTDRYDLALASYNWGIGNVLKSPEPSSFPMETQNYIHCVLEEKMPMFTDAMIIV